MRTSSPRPSFWLTNLVLVIVLTLDIGTIKYVVSFNPSKNVGLSTPHTISFSRVTSRNRWQRSLQSRWQRSIIPQTIALHETPKDKEKGVDDIKRNDAMSENEMTHAMLRVPSVNQTLSFWEEKGAIVHNYRRNTKSETAFVGFASDGKGTEGGFFSLEVTSLPKDEMPDIGNAVKYFGLSMLLNFDLKRTAAGLKPPAPTVGADPNGLEVRYVAAGPGDSFSRICLRLSNESMDKTLYFYDACLGMKVVASDEKCVCFRYSPEDEEKRNLRRKGVATTLVFEKSSDGDPNWDGSLNIGNYFDHLAISTRDLADAEMAIREKLPDCIFMEPTKMFGTKIMGLKDPNGYKVYLVERS